METAFVGRGAEISALHRQWQRARDGNLEYTLIRGEPGSGKTRLMEEFHGLVSLSGGSNIMFVRRAASEPFRPYALFAELASHLMRMPGAAGCNPELLPFLTRLTRATFARETDPTTPDETAFISTGIKRAIVDLIESVSGEKPCLILLDDSRAIDDVSLGLLRELPALAPTLRVHLAITCDTLDSREDMLLPSSATLSLTPLCAEASQELLTGLLAKMDRRLDTETFEWCVRVAAGNPAFLSLLGAHAAESPGLPDVPVDIIEVVDKRIAGLSPIVVRVLAACAVLGDDDCTSHLLECVLAIEPLALLGALHELEHGGLIAYSDERIHLRSALFRDRVLQSTGGSVLSLLHGRCAAAMEAEPASAGCDWRIASHWRRAGQHNRARATLMNSWRASLQLGQPKQAVASLREYLSLTTDTVERVTLHDGLIELTQAMRDGQATVQAIDERQKLVCAAQLNDPRREALSFDRLDAVFHDDGDQSAYASELVAFMNSRELDTHRRLSASLELMICADAKVDPVLADMVLKKLLVPDESDQRARHTYHSIKLIFHSVFGDKSEALRLSRELISSTASDFGHWPDARARFRASMAILLTGDARAATDLLEACYARFASAGALSTCVAISGRLANFYFDEGDLDHAREWERRAAAHVAEDVERILPCEYLSVRADLALVAGDFATARGAIAVMRDANPLYRAPRYSMDLLAYELRLAQFEGAPVADSDVQRLLDWHFIARGYTRHDDVMDSLWVGLVAQGRASYASSLLREYLCHFRREPKVCAFLLRTRTAGDPAWLMAAPTATPTVRST
ncbi:MAG: AAA family ATPase [bacterium]